MLYLRQFSNLESVNLAGNPICREANYKSYMLSHIKYLKYLDYVRVKAADVQAAIEHHQDEVCSNRSCESTVDTTKLCPTGQQSCTLLPAVSFLYILLGLNCLDACILVFVRDSVRWRN